MNEYNEALLMALEALGEAQKVGKISYDEYVFHFKLLTAIYLNALNLSIGERKHEIA